MVQATEQQRRAMADQMFGVAVTYMSHHPNAGAAAQVFTAGMSAAMFAVRLLPPPLKNTMLQALHELIGKELIDGQDPAKAKNQN